MIHQLNPPIPVVNPKGKALAHLLIDEGIEHDLKWVCFQDGTGECWTFRNPDVRAQKNITQGRDYISPFYDPADVAFPKKEFVAPATGTYRVDSPNEQKGWIHENIMGDYLQQQAARLKERQKIHDAIFSDIKSQFPPPETDLQKQVKEAKRMSETMPDFETLVKDANSIANNAHQEKIQEQISKVASDLRGNEMKIVDDFCKAYYASLMHMTGKEFMQIVEEVSLNVQQFFKDGQVATRYWFSPKEKDESNT